MNRNDLIEKTGLVLDRILMQSPELTSINSSESESDTIQERIEIKNNEGFRKYLKDVNLLMYLDYPSVYDLLKWNIINEDQVLVGINTSKVCRLESLSQILKDKTQKLSSTDKIVILYGIAKAICFFQSKFVVHGHLDTQNILIECKNENKYPKITNFKEAEVFYDPASIELDMFLNDLECFRILVIEILQNSECDPNKCTNDDLLQYLGNLEITPTLKKAIEEMIQSQSDPVTCMRQFVQDIEKKVVWFEDTDVNTFESYREDFISFKEKKMNEDSDVLNYIEVIRNEKNSNQTELKKMVEKLVDESLNGNYTADFNLGICYLRGIGVPANFGIGYHYISKSAQKLPFARALKIMLKKNSSVLEEEETSTTLYQKGQIYEYSKKYDEAIEYYARSVAQATKENKSYTPSIGRIGRLLTCRSNVNRFDFDEEYEMLGIDYLKIGYDNDDPYAIYELFIYFRYKNIRMNKTAKDVVYASPRIDNDPNFREFRAPEPIQGIPKNKIVYNRKSLTKHLYDKAVSLGLLVNKVNF